MSTFAQTAEAARSAAVDDGTLAITSAIAAGDQAAFTRLFTQRFDEMLAEARRVVRRDDDFSHDVVQDAMLRVIRSMRPIASEAGLRAWLRAVVRSCAYDRLRREQRRIRRERRVAPPGPPGTPASPESTPAAGDLDDRLAWLRREMLALDRDSARLLIMRHRFGWTLGRIGRVVGLAPGAVDGRLRRIVRRLRRRAEEERHDR